MDKNAIKKYAVWARRELIEKVSQKALQYGIEDGKELDPKLDSINGILLTDDEKKQRQALIRKINENGYAQVMEEVAYTWFNRFIALRFMEVNGYLPSHVRVFTDEAGEFKPQIMSEALHLELKGLDMEKVYELKNDNKDDDLFKYLLITQCNDLSDIFPKMFQKIADYTELLLPDYLLREGSVIEQMVNQKEGIPEADWQDQVQIIGWLYQYYNTEPKDKVFADLKKNVKITKETIPAATQLFTPDWIVHYMVENSLGRLWLEGHPNDTLKGEWKYYLDEAEQEPDVQKQLEEIRKEYAGLKPEEIRCIDPCMGSGHILCVLFDTLIKIYEDYGYPARDAAASIVENNLWGLDIDERAAQLAYFAVMMKARQYDRRFLTRGIQPHVYAIEESNGLNYDGDYGDFLLDKNQQETLSYMYEVFKDAKEYGSILNVEQRDYDSFLNAWKLTAEQTLSDVRMMGWYMYAGDKIFTIASQAKALSQKYHVVVTNPPYMGSSGMNSKLADFIKKRFPDEKSDLSTCFMNKCLDLCNLQGYMSMINIPVWMFLSSYEKMRYKLMRNNTYSSVLHFGRGVFGADFGTVAFTFRKMHIKEYKGKYLRLFDKQSSVDSVDQKEKWFLQRKGENEAIQESFDKIPGAPVAYWISDSIMSSFDKGIKIDDLGSARQGIIPGNVNEFLRLWFEVSNTKIGFNHSEFTDINKYGYKWFPYNKGGAFRKWYGNIDYVINMENEGYDIKFSGKNNNFRLREPDLYFQEAVTWSKLTIGAFSSRYMPAGNLFDIAGCCVIFLNENLRYVLGFTNSVVCKEILSVISPTLNYEVDHIKKLPVLIDREKKTRIDEIVQQNIDLSKDDWDSYETSMDFCEHPLIKYANFDGNNKREGLVSEIFDRWIEVTNKRLLLLKNNEEELNRLFICIYELEDELRPEINDDALSVSRANIQHDIRSLISYAVGCMFGRYSLDVPGLAYAGGDWDASKYKTFQADSDAIIPICDDEYFKDDIVGRFVKFVEVVYGKDTLEDNLKFIADALGGNGTSREVIRNYFINDFYADHVKIYQKRPIYWLFDSGKKNGFKCLIYMHRYQPDTIARIRTDYVHEQQARYRTAIEEIEKRMETASQSDKVKLTKKLNTLKAQDEEIHAYEEKIHHLADQMISIDLDDGVKHNYALFQDVLAKIK